jgi:dienelactone hydrolase
MHKLILILPFLFAPPRIDETALRHQIEKTFFVADPLPPPDARQFGQIEIEPGIVADRITYATQFGMRVPAIVYHPVNKSLRRPALIIVNGHGGDKYSWYSFYSGVLFARAGGVVLTYDPAGEGERNAQRKSGSRQHDKYVPPDDNGRRMAGLMMTDLREAVSYLHERPDVDPARIAAAGYSMGSFVVSIACAVETRLNACVAVGGGNLDGPGGYWDSSSKKMCQAIPYQSLSFLGDRGAVLFALNARRGAMLIHNGSTDDVVAISTGAANFFADLRERTIKLLGSDKNVFEFSFTPEGGHRPYFVTRPVGEWLNKQLRFPAWDTISHDETKIGDWAKANGVPMDKMYADDHREGGTIALGKDIPFVTHDKLNALPESEWASQKSDFVLETWFARASAASKGGGQQHER